MFQVKDENFRLFASGSKNWAVELRSLGVTQLSTTYQGNMMAKSEGSLPNVELVHYQHTLIANSLTKI